MNQDECTHSDEQRALVGTWVMDEVRKAIEKGYSCDTADDKDKYIKQYLEKEGIQLNPDKIEKNPGLRQVGKAVITTINAICIYKSNHPQHKVVRSDFLEKCAFDLIRPQIEYRATLQQLSAEIRRRSRALLGISEEAPVPPPPRDNRLFS
ncbi:hypothetical protein QE152_g40774 [Popillia japonica]|uniref:Uncharacterized protein n=1 Tax=Popillia japonica TaxID=7064 RepID=A0AAW1HFC9_POPJA